MTNYNIRRFSEKDIPRLTDLLASCFTFHAHDALASVRWKYTNTNLKRNLISYIAATDEGAIISQYANIETPLSLNTQTIQAFNCIDMATHPDHRGQGLISTLSKHVYADIAKTDAVLSFGFSNEQGVQVDKHAKGYGYTIVGQFTRYVKMVLPGPTKNNPLQKTLSFDTDPSVPADNKLLIAKTKEYLTWRYIERPEKTYRLYSLTIGQCTGYMVLLAQNFKLVILDIIGFSSADMPGVLAAIEGEAKRLRKTMIIAHVLDNAGWKQAMHTAGFSSTPSRKHVYLTVKMHKPERLQEIDVLSPDSWNMVSGDIW